MKSLIHNLIQRSSKFSPLNRVLVERCYKVLQLSTFSCAQSQEAHKRAARTLVHSSASQRRNLPCPCQSPSSISKRTLVLDQRKDNVERVLLAQILILSQIF